VKQYNFLPLSLHLLIIGFILFISCSNQTNETNTSDSKSGQEVFALGTSGDTCNVYKVVDGDTFWGKTADGRQIKVRLIGIDAPETRNTAKKPAVPFGKVSKKYLNDLIIDKKVILNYDIDKTDRWGRALAYVYIENGLFVNEDMIRYGYAVVMTVPPNVRFSDRFIRLQREAREAGRGMWAIELTGE